MGRKVNALMQAQFQPKTLKALREMQGMPQGALARAMGYAHRMTIWQWESPTHKSVPNEEQIEQLGKIFNVNPKVFTQALDAEFKELVDEDIKAFVIAALTSDNTSERRLALEFYKHAYPESWSSQKEKEETKGISLSDFMSQNQPPPSDEDEVEHEVPEGETEDG